MYLITQKNDDGASVVVALSSNLESATIAAKTKHPCTVWRLYTDSANLLPAWDAERFEKMRKSVGTTGEECHG